MDDKLGTNNLKESVRLNKLKYGRPKSSDGYGVGGTIVPACREGVLAQRYIALHENI